MHRTHTPWLDIKCDNRLGGRLDLASLLLVVLGQTLGLELLGLLVDLIVVAAEQVELVIVLLSLLGCRGRVQSDLRRVGSVSSELLGGVTGKGLKLALKGEEVVVPAPCVRELLWSGNLLNLLEDLHVGLRWGVAVLVSASDSSRGTLRIAATRREVSEVRQALGFVFR
jgi:hypothetical protein